MYQSEVVRQIHTYLLQLHGKKAMWEADKQRDRQLDQMAQHAQALVRERFSIN
jgi:hypothetical protein